MVPQRGTGTYRRCLSLQKCKAPGLHIVMQLTQFNFHVAVFVSCLQICWRPFGAGALSGRHVDWSTYIYFHILFWYVNAAPFAQLFVTWDPAWLRGLLLLTTPRPVGPDDERWAWLICSYLLSCAAFARSSSPFNPEKLCCNKHIRFSRSVLEPYCWWPLAFGIKCASQMMLMISKITLSSFKKWQCLSSFI